MSPRPDRPDRGWRLAPGLGARRGRQALIVVFVMAATILVVRAPSVAGTSWAAVGKSVLGVGPLWLLAMAVVWLAGLSLHSAAMIAALPGLTLRRALGLNLAGSAVANSVPLGGALSYGLTAAMASSWGFTPTAVTAFFALTNICNVLVRLIFGLVALTWFMDVGPGLTEGISTLIISAIAATSVLVACAVLSSNTLALWAGRVVAVVRRWWRRTFNSQAPARRDNVNLVLIVRQQMVTLIRDSWPRLIFGMGGYLILLGLLLDFCLRSLGAPQPIVLVIAVVGIERLVTAVPLTPGGAGAAELALFACLTAAGTGRADAVAAVLLYRFFAFLIEIPVGALVALSWRIASRRATRRVLTKELRIPEPVA